MAIHISEKLSKMFIMVMAYIAQKMDHILRDIGKMAKQRGKEQVSINLGINIQEIFYVISDMDKECRYTKMEKDTKAAFRTISNGDMESIYIKMVTITKEIGKKICVKVQAEKYM